MRFWTPETVADVVRRYRAGEAPSAIGASYGVSRNTINSKLDRLGALRRRVAVAPTVVAGKRLKAPAVKVNRVAVANQANGAARKVAAVRLIPAGNNAVLHCPPGEPPRAMPKAGAFEPLPGTSPRPFLERGPGQCRWPVGGEGAGLVACCAPAPGSTYCPTHTRAACASEAAKARLDSYLGIPRSAAR